MSAEFLELLLDLAPPPAAKTAPARRADFIEDLLAFRDFGTDTRQMVTRSATFDGQPLEVPTFVNEFWTAMQRQASSLHEVSYRACFKPQLPHFFIERLTQPGDVVYDPFMGRGTTPVEAALLGCVAAETTPRLVLIMARNSPRRLLLSPSGRPCLRKDEHQLVRARVIYESARGNQPASVVPVVQAERAILT